MRILLVGGSKSGKSRLAQSIVKKLADGGPMYYWAAMEPTDSEDVERIEKHVADREGWGFETVECGRSIENAPALPPDSAVLFDSVTALLANEMFTGEKVNESAPGAVLRGLLAVSGLVKHFVCVADEVFRDGTVYDRLTELYRAGLAEVLSGLAEEFDTVCEISCGLVKTHKGRLPAPFGGEK